MKAGGAGGVVVASAQITALMHGVPTGLVSLGLGITGVALARWVFVNREQRRIGRRESWRETLPLTLVAMLIAGVFIHDRGMGLSGAAFTGLGVGWAAVLLLDVLGARVTDMLRAMLGSTPVKDDFPGCADHSGHDGRIDSDVAHIPRDMAKMLDKMDRQDRGGDTKPPL